MRHQLKQKYGQRLLFEGTVERFGIKRGWKGCEEKTILIKDLVFADDQQYADDHLWFTVGKRIAKLNLKSGDVIQFEARISAYTKGYVRYSEFIDNRHTDYKLNNPTKIKVVNRKELVIN